ncbi:MAG: Ppx/GppA phosphatase family protein [Propionibacteriaceae bacterium]|nr:Ppx/GppA family phosphatase [Micropruina sp.]
MKLAAIDCGTNSVRLLIAEVRPDRTLADIDRRLHLTRLGQGVDATGEFAPDALARTLDAVADFAAEIKATGVERTRFVATAAARDARNREAFFTGVQERVGVPAEIIPGEEEAWLSFRGALASLAAPPEPVLVIDVGGGSTELVVGRGGAVEAGVSIQVGSVRVRERFLHSDPPTVPEIAAAAAHIDALLDGTGLDLAAVRTWIGVGGTVTSLSALHQNLPTYERARVHHSTMAPGDVTALADRLLAMPVAEVRDFPTMVPKRADVICAGALVVARIAARLNVPLLISETDILDGMILGMLDEESPS